MVFYTFFQASNPIIFLYILLITNHYNFIDYEIDTENSVLNYTFISDDTLQITDEEGDVNIAHRLNSDLVGSWSGVLTEDDGSQGQINIDFYDDSLGVEELVWPSDSSNEAITWMSTSTEITIFFNDSASDNLILGYTFIDINNVDVTIEGEFATTLTRNQLLNINRAHKKAFTNLL